MKKLHFFLTGLLFLVLIYTRLSIRISNPLWTDEIEQVKHLTTFYHLIFDYLPRVPGGFPGHYLLTLPINKLFSGNKYFLGLPGLIAHILVFIFIPKVIAGFNLVDEKKLALSSLIARAGFAFDPTLSFQAMEVRPYSFLPLLWLVVAVLAIHMVFFPALYALSFLLAVFIWHFYSAIMLTSICLFLLAQRDISKRTLLLVLSGMFLSLPFWIYFGKGTDPLNLDTFRHLTYVLVERYTITRETVEGLLGSHILLLPILLVTVALFLVYFFSTRKVYIDSLSKAIFIKMNIFLVVFPCLLILVVDLLTRYWFLYRQFTWVMVPFYISIGVLISGFKLP